MEKRTGSNNNFKTVNGTNVTSPINNTNPYAKQEIQLAILDFQRFMSIPITGSLDTKTMETMNKPRCGVPDKSPTDFSHLNLKVFLTPRGKRKRRNALQYFSKHGYAQEVYYEWYVDPKHRSRRLISISNWIIEFGINLWAASSNVIFQNRDGWNWADIIFSFHTSKFFTFMSLKIKIARTLHGRILTYLSRCQNNKRHSIFELS